MHWLFRELNFTLFAASLACSMSSLTFFMLSEMLFVGGNFAVTFSTSAILSFRDGMIFNS